MKDSEQLWIRSRRSNVPLHVRKKHKETCSHNDVIVLEDEMEKYKEMFPKTEVRSKARISSWWSQKPISLTRLEQSRKPICDIFCRTRVNTEQCSDLFDERLCGEHPLDSGQILHISPNKYEMNELRHSDGRCYAWIVNAANMYLSPETTFCFQFQLRRHRRNDEKSPLRGERRRRRRRRFAAVSEEAFKFSTTTSTKFFKGRGFTISNNKCLWEKLWKKMQNFSRDLGFTDWADSF